MLLLQKGKSLYFHAFFLLKKQRKKKPQRLMGKNFRPGSRKVIVWNTQQNLKHTAKPSVLILPHCTQFSNYGHLCTTGSLSCQVSSSSTVSAPFYYTFCCFICWDFWFFFRLLTSMVTVDTPGAKRMNESVASPFHTLQVTANRAEESMKAVHWHLW